MQHLCSSVTLSYHRSSTHSSSKTSHAY